MSDNKLKSLTMAALMVLSVFAGAVAFTGSAAAGATHDYDDTLTTGSANGASWAGQSLLYTDNPDEQLTLYSVSDSDRTFEREIVTEADGHAVINTEELSGSYVLVNESSTETTFDVYAQTLSAGLNDGTVENGDVGNSNEVELQYDSNRASFQLNVSSPDLTAEELEQVFVVNGDYAGAFTLDTEEDVLTLEDASNSNTNDLTANFTGIEAGSYDFSFDVVDTPASDSDSIEVVEAQDADASFDSVIFSDERGDIAKLVVNLENTNSADVTLGSSDINYVLDMSVTDDNDDDQVVVEFNTLLAGQSAPGVVDVEDSDDSVVVNSETSLTDALEAGAYELSAATSAGETDVASFDLNERSTDSVNVHTAPAAENIEELDDVSEYASMDNSVAVGDKMIVQIEASGLSAYLESASAAGLAEGSVFADGTGISLELEQQNPGPNSEPKALDVSQGTLLNDGENDTYYVAFDLNDLNVEADDEYAATFTVNESNVYVDEEEDTEEVSADFSVVERDISFDALRENADGDEVLEYRLDSEQNLTVSGDSTVAAGTEFTLRLRSVGDAPFLKAQKVSVQDDDSFAAVFSMDSVSVDTDFSTQAAAFGAEFDSSLATDSASVSVSDQSAAEQGEEVRVDDVTLPYGGFVIVHDADGAIAGVSNYLDAGSHSDVVVALDEPVAPGDYSMSAMAHMDSGDEQFDAAEDSAYTVDGEPVAADLVLTVEEPRYMLAVNVDGAENAEVTVDGESKAAEGGVAMFELENGDYSVSVSADGFEDGSADVSIAGADAEVSVSLEAVEEPADDNSSDDNASDEEPVSDDESEGSTPGFGAIVAVLAVLGAALLATRRE